MSFGDTKRSGLREISAIVMKNGELCALYGGRHFSILLASEKKYQYKRCASCEKSTEPKHYFTAEPVRHPRYD